MLHTSSKAHFQYYVESYYTYIARILLEEQASAVPVEAKGIEFTEGIIIDRIRGMPIQTEIDPKECRQHSFLGCLW
jgi:hypothetical protein